MKIEKAIIEDANELTELTILSKSYWDYSEQQIEDWKNDLTITEGYILEKDTFKLINENKIIGYYSFFKTNNSDLKLDNLFVAPIYIGKGIGKKLVIDFFKRILIIEFEKVILDADPNVEKFYLDFGFNVIGKLETSIKNRYLPIMEINKARVQQYIKMH